MTSINGKPPVSAHNQVSTQAPSPSALPPGQERGARDLAPGQSPKTTAENVVSQLKERGFQAGASAPKDLAGQLAGALREFQKGAGLPPNGQLGGKTNEALKNIGVAGQPPESAAPSPAQAKDDFERGGGGLLKQGEKSRADIAKNSSPDTNFLDALINKLGGDQGVTADKHGFVGGSQQTADAQKAEAAKEAKKVNEADNKSGSTSEAKKSAREESQQQLDRAKQEQKVQVARGLKTEQARTDEQKRKNALFGKDPTEKGILDEEADEDDDYGQGGEGKKRGKGGDQDGGGHDDSGTDTAGGVGERDGNERSKGNASSGGEDDGDARRGHASIDDGSGDGAGHYRVPSLSEQAFAALLKIQKDPAISNKATSYSWDVLFYKPGVYGAGQKAQDLVHLVVTSATAFDPVWQKAQANLQVLVRRLEPNGAVPTIDDIVAALRQARARAGDVEAVQLGKLKRPPGRA